MFTFLGVLQTLSGLVIAISLGYVAYNLWKESQPQREEAATRQRFSAAGNVHDPSNEDSIEHARANLKFLNIPDVSADRVILNVPSISPMEDGVWQSKRYVLTRSYIGGYNGQGEELPMQFIEFGDGYAFLVTGKNAYLLKQCHLSTRQQNDLERERSEAVQKGDQAIKGFLGNDWIIKRAMGDNKHPERGGKKCSYIEVLSSSKKLGESGFESTLPPNILDGRSYDYYDLQCVSDDDQVLFAFYTGGCWTCYVGRALKTDEKEKLQGL